MDVRIESRQTCRQSFVFYRSFYDALKHCDRQVRAKVYDSIFEYMFENVDISIKEDENVYNALMILIKPQLDSLNKKYNAGLVNKLRIIEDTKTKKEQMESDILIIQDVVRQDINDIKIDDDRKTSNVNENVNDNVNGNVIDVYHNTIYKKEVALKMDRAKKVFIPPSQEEWMQYFRENGYREDVGLRSFKSYQVADWKDSRGNKLKNWKQKLQQVWFTEQNKIVSTDAKKETYTMPTEYKPYNQSK